jgi:class 3 adenylate cyclase
MAYEAARIAALANGNEVLASKRTVGSLFPASEPRVVTLKGIAEPMEIVTVTWR